jgi:hypothetical protein
MSEHLLAIDIMTLSLSAASYCKLHIYSLSPCSRGRYCLLATHYYYLTAALCRYRLIIARNVNHKICSSCDDCQLLALLVIAREFLRLSNESKNGLLTQWR